MATTTRQQSIVTGNMAAKIVIVDAGNVPAWSFENTAHGFIRNGVEIHRNAASARITPSIAAPTHGQILANFNRFSINDFSDNVSSMNASIFQTKG